MRIKNSNLNRLLGGLDQLGRLEIEDFNLNLGISENIEKLEPLSRSYNKSREALISGYVKMDEYGNPISKDEIYSFKSIEDKTTYLEKIDKLNEMETEVNLFKIKRSDLAKVKSVEVIERGIKIKKIMNAGIMFMLSEIVIKDNDISRDLNK